MEAEKVNEVKESLQRMQKFDIDSLPREQELGSQLNFLKVIIPAQRLISLFDQISIRVLEDIPDKHLDNLKKQADANYNLFEQILNFSTNIANPAGTRDTYIEQVRQAYDQSFNALLPIITYSTSKTADFKRLETEARAAMQEISDESKKLVAELNEKQEEAKIILEEIRKTAAEQGVTQQASYFKNEADMHLEKANSWKISTIWISMAWGCMQYYLYSCINSIFLHPPIHMRAFNWASAKY